MNYFGLFFSFMLPGIFIGAMTIAVIRREVISRKRRTARETRERERKNVRKLYVHNFEAAVDRAA